MVGGFNLLWTFKLDLPFASLKLSLSPAQFFESGWVLP
jgi:hypothetical protein